MDKEIKINDKIFLVREMLASEADEFVALEDKKLSLKMQILASTGISESEYKVLTFKERLLIVNTMNELNGLSEVFPKP